MGDIPETMDNRSSLVGNVIFRPYRAGYLGQSILPGFRCGASPTLHPGLTNVPLAGATNRYPFTSGTGIPLMRSFKIPLGNTP